MKKLYIYITMLIFGVAFNENTNPQLNDNQIAKKMFQAIWDQAMEAKSKVKQVTPNVREELLSNLCSSAPSESFITHADLSDSLTQAENTSASVFVSTDNQSSWIENSNVAPLNLPGYETTWGATTATSGGDNVHWYLSGSIDSQSLGLGFGQIIVAQSPYNANDQWPPSSNLYGVMATDPTGETGSGQDIVGVRATYSDTRLYASMDLNGSCCSEGGFFGPWNLYSIAVVNPDAGDAPTAYAYVFGNGGLGQIYPGIYKIDGDLTTGEVAGFEVLSTDFQYSTNGNSLQANSALDIIVNDAGWGTWPNSFNGVVLVGVVVSAGGDIIFGGTPEILDTSEPGVLVMTTQVQNGNIAPTLSDPILTDSGEVSVVYTDLDNNLATVKQVSINNMTYDMIPSTHTYSEGVVFSAQVEGGGIAQFNFSDGAASVSLEADLGGAGCSLLGDANEDSQINVLDVVLTVNLILSPNGQDNLCSDINGDSQLNVLDVVSLVNLILGRN